MEISSGDEPVIKSKDEVYDSTTEWDQSNPLEDEDDLLKGTLSSMEKNKLSDVPDENENGKLTALSENFKFESPKPKLCETSTLTKALTRDEQSDNSSCVSNTVLLDLHHDKSLTESTVCESQFN